MIDFNSIRNRYLIVHELEGIHETEIHEAQNILNVILPLDFIEISLFFSGGFFGGISNNSFNRYMGCTNIIDETIKLRDSIMLPHEYIVLAEPPESLIVLNTLKNPSVIWCDAVEAEKLESGSFETEPDIWESYGEFFEQLLEDEEEEQNE